ncbi:MAG: TIGR00341 family protein, partial [Bacteroidia bacterium]
AIIYWQFNSMPEMQRSSISKRVEAIIQDTINNDNEVGLIETNSRFTRAEIPEQNTLLCEIYLQRMENNTGNDELINKLQRKISQNIKMDYKDVTPVIAITILEKQDE